MRVLRRAEPPANEGGDWVDDFAVVPPRLVRKAEEHEEEQTTEHHRPTAELEGDDRGTAHFPQDSGEELNAPVVEVGVGEADPGHDGPAGVEVESVARQGGSAEEFDGGQRHEAEVATHGKRG